jgi:hypothetical protein
MIFLFEICSPGGEITAWKISKIGGMLNTKIDLMTFRARYCECWRKIN